MIYVDALTTSFGYDKQTIRVGARNGHKWCHLFADTPEELHACAQKLALRREWAQVSSTGILHYDLTPARRQKAVAAGARELDRRQTAELLRHLRRATGRSE